MLPQKYIALIIEWNHKSGISGKQLFWIKIREISPVTIYNHYDKLRNKGLHLENKIRC